MQENLHRIINGIYSELLEKSLQRYNEGNKVDRKDREEFERIKKETAPIFELINHWEKEVNDHIATLNVMPNQVENTKDNMELLLLHSYYIDVRRKRFMELYHSIDYVMNRILND
ncbi:DUF1798 family protein [Virgibacillus sp. MSP4-1]|uniref:DUF1798 family protein n=1 Tax=Virgibacillus sp. MSP4-1 TaxID=2700081 RepID=UPI00039A5611|nr:DUF1798 family protein [Virgibacillus sp. MSP4-1]QHS22551.1 DUF1798 family protein [Virgibacillus sp. MSP4-1]